MILLIYLKIKKGDYMGLFSKKNPIKIFDDAKDWLSTEFYYFKIMQKNLANLKKDIEKASQKDEVKDIKKALQNCKYIGRAERRLEDYEKHIEKSLTDIQKRNAISITDKELDNVLQRIRIEAAKLIKYSSLYEGEIKKYLTHLQEKIKDNEIEKAQSTLIEINQAIEDVEKWLGMLSVDINNSKIIYKRTRVNETLSIDQIKEEDKRNFTYSLVGYGSLMNADETMNELKSTLKKTGTTIKNIMAEFKTRVTPVWVVGYKRIFNKVATRKKWETDEDIKANMVAVLNIAASRNHKFNAVAIKLTDDEYNSIREREKNYGVIELKHVYDYRSGQRLNETCICVKSNPLKVYVPIDKREKIKFYAERIRKFAYGMDSDRLIKSNKMPIPRYIEVIDIGVRKLDALLETKGMYDNFLNTTFCYYIDRTQRRDYGEIKLIDYYQLIANKI